MKMVIGPVYLPFNISLPAAPLLIFWMCKDFFLGLLSLATPNGVAHWAHVGGFLFGLIVGKIKKYGHEGAVEHYSDKVLHEVRGKGGWKDAGSEKELLKLIGLNPKDPDMHLQLGQYYHEHDRNAEAEASYLTAIQKYFLTNPLYGSYAMVEYVEAFGKTMASPHHLRAGETLAKNGDIEEAYKVIKPMALSADQGSIAERIVVLYLKLCKALLKGGELEDGLKQFNQNFPLSRYKNELEDALRKEPEEVFPAKAPSPQALATEGTGSLIERGPQESRFFAVGYQLFDIVVDPLFLFFWFFTLFVLYVFVADLNWRIQMLSFFLPFAFVSYNRLDWSQIFKDLTVDEAAARLASDLTTTYNRAVLAERGENYPAAAKLYEKVLLHDTHNIQARFNLARIYLNKLSDRSNGLRQLQMLKKTAPDDHPFYQYAVDNMSSSNSSNS